MAGTRSHYMRRATRISNYYCISLFIFFTNSINAQDHNILVKNNDYLRSYQVYLQGESYYQQKKYDNAIAEYRKAIKLFDQYPECYYKLIKIFLYKQELTQINQYIKPCYRFKNRFKYRSEELDFYKITADYYELSMNYSKALTNYLLLIHAKSNNIYYKYKIGYLYYKVGINDIASDYLFVFKDVLKKNQQVFKYREEYKTCIKMLVNISLDQNNYVQAYELLKEIYVYFPEEDVLNKLIMISNNLKHYGTNY
jgi:tetratricopeptide (TPR) repeat protein